MTFREFVEGSQEEAAELGSPRDRNAFGAPFPFLSGALFRQIADQESAQ